jgi:hypothetical protein
VRRDRLVNRPDAQVGEPQIGAADRGLQAPLDVADALPLAVSVEEDRALLVTSAELVCSQFPA